VARDYFKVVGHGYWHDLNDCVPNVSDLVYYEGEHEGESSHVGLVIDVGTNVYYANEYTSIECNLSDHVKRVFGNYVSGQCRNDGENSDSGRIAQGFATPLWT
jgi:hypothetical protein